MPPDAPAARSRINALLPAICVLLLAAVHIALSAAWMRHNGFFSERPPFQDAAYWRMDSWNMLRAWQQGGVGAWLQAGLDHDRPHPPLLTMLAAFTSLPEGDVSVESQWRVEMIFVLFFAIAAYRLARNFGGRWFSVLATAAMMSAPVIIVSERVFYPKFPLMVTVLASLDALLRSRAFTRLGWSIAFGVLSGIATLTFMLAPLYIIGSAAFALVVGLVRSRARGGVVLNAMLAIVAMLLVASIWYARHWEQTLRYATAVTGSAGQATFSRGLGLWSFERWIFYPRALVNSGLGFFLSAWIVGLMIVRGTRRLTQRRRGETPDAVPWHLPGATLAAGAIVSFLAIVPGQTAGDAEYVMNCAPLGLLFAAWAISRIENRKTRRNVGVAFGATCAVMIALSYRSVHGDAPALAFGGLRVIDTYDHYGGAIVRWMEAEIRPEGEVWPFDEFLDVMVERSPMTQIRLGQHPHLHPYMNSGNVIHAASLRGIQLKVEPLRLDADRQAIESFTKHADFIILDKESIPIGRSYDVISEFIKASEAAGAKVDVVAQKKMAPRCHLLLLQIVRPYDRPTIVPASVENEPGFRKLDVTFDNGWRLAGLELINVDGATAIARTFWDVDPPGAPGFDLIARVGNWDHVLAYVRVPMSLPAKNRGAERSFASVAVQFDLNKLDPALPMWIALARRGSGKDEPDVYARLVETHGRTVGAPYFVNVLP